MDKNIKYIVGIDEVGRGPIAGPVAVCAFLCVIENYDLIIKNAKEELNLPLRDSKKLSKKQRKKWFEFFKLQKKEGKCDYAVSYVSPENIDKFGIAPSIKKALEKSLEKLSSSDILFEKSSDEGGRGIMLSRKEYPTTLSIFLDGGLYAPSEYVNQKTFIKGDELYPIISCASIVAKVSRDKIMTDYEKEFPGYGFDKHSGYGTKAHYEAIKKHGQTPIHRKSFIHILR